MRSTMSVSVYYDYFEGLLAPVWMIVKPTLEEWESNRIRIDIESPFIRKMSEELSNDLLSVSVELDDLILLEDQSHTFCITLERLISKIQSSGYAPSDIDQLIIQMCDVEEVLHMDPQKHFGWRLNHEGIVPQEKL